MHRLDATGANLKFVLAGIELIPFISTDSLVASSSPGLLAAEQLLLIFAFSRLVRRPGKWWPMVDVSTLYSGMMDHGLDERFRFR
jgi:hypothetical protein